MGIEEKQFEAIYYPDCYPKSMEAFASSALFFDRLNFVTPSSITSDSVEHTKFLKTLSQEDFKIYAMLGDTERDRKKYGMTRRTISRLAEYYEFISNIKDLLGEVVFYHPNLLSSAIHNMQSKLTSGEGVSIGELFDLMNGETEEQTAIKEFVKDNPNLDDGILELVLPTARHLAFRNNWITVSDVSALPIPVVDRIKTSADYLASQIALELINVSIPLAKFTDASDILEARETLSGELIEFRVLMLQMAADLRSLLGNEPNHEVVREEARFLVNTKLEPILYEVRKRLAEEKKKLWWRLFGKTVKYVPMIAGSFIDPSKVSLLKAIHEGSKDAKELLGDARNIASAGSTGISYLIKLDEMQ